MKQLATLLCGGTTTDGVAKTALAQLSSSIADFSARSLTFLKDPTAQDTLVFGPFCARALLENSCAALVGRFDCFRILYLSEFQSQPEYEHGRRAKSAFAWFGTVGELAEAPDRDLDRIDYIGPAKIERIRAVVYQAIWM